MVLGRREGDEGGGRGAVYRYVKPYRRTHYHRGITYPIAICLRCRGIVEPSAVRSSDSGRCGDLYYEHEHPLYFIELEQSNKGNRYVRVDPELEDALPDLVGLVKQRWFWKCWSPEEVEDDIEGYFSTSKRPR